MKQDFETWAQMWCEYKKPFVKKSTYAMYTFIIDKHLVPFFKSHRAMIEEVFMHNVGEELAVGQ